MTKHTTHQLCPICSTTFVEHVHCAHAECTFYVTTCPRCDKEQAVREFLKDHETDCDRRDTAPFVRQLVA